MLLNRKASDKPACLVQTHNSLQLEKSLILYICYTSEWFEILTISIYYFCNI